MGKRLYLISRDLHLYFGLFISPFVLVFSFSIFFLVHTWIPGSKSAIPVSRTAKDVRIPPDLDRLTGRPRVEAVKDTLRQLGVEGEVGNIRHLPKEHRLLIPVVVPGRETTVDVDLANRTAKIEQRNTGIWDAMVLLHKSPGPHLVAIRMNWAYMGVWRWLADTTVYVLLFLSITGVYLWAVLKAERRIGLVLLGAGAISFFGIVYGLYI